MSNLPVPASAAHIQVLNGKASSTTASAARGVNGSTSESPGEAFGSVLQSQILGLATSLKTSLKKEDKVEIDGLKEADAKIAQEAAVAEGVGSIFAPFSPVAAVPVVADVRKLAGDISSSNSSGLQAEPAVLQSVNGVGSEPTVKAAAADFAGSGKFLQSVDLARQSNALGENAKDLFKSTADVVQNVDIAKAAKGIKTTIVDGALKPADVDKLRVSGSAESLLKTDGSEFLVRTEGYNNVAPAQISQSAQLPSIKINPTVGTPGWDVALGQKLVWVANQTNQVAELHLNPPNLGPLEVRLTINNDQTTAIFVSNHPEVRDAIESAIPRLREMLADNGLTLGNVSVGSQSLSQQQQSFNGNERQTAETRGSQSISFENSSSEMVTNVVRSTSWNKGMVDTFA